MKSRKELIQIVSDVRSHVESGDYQSAIKKALGADFGPYYSLSSQLHQLNLRIYRHFTMDTLFIETSVQCLSKNMNQFAPKGFLSYLREMFREIDPSTQAKWIKQGSYVTIQPSPNNFIQFSFSFNETLIPAFGSIFIHFSFHTCLPDALEGVSIAYEIVDDMDNSKCVMLSDSTTLYKDKKQIFDSEFKPKDDVSYCELKNIVVTFDDINFIFPVTNSKVDILPYESECTLNVKQPHDGIVGIPLPFTFSFTSKKACGYNVMFGWEIMKPGSSIVLSNSPDSLQSIPTSIIIEKPDTTYSVNLYLFGHKSVQTNIEITWSIFNQMKISPPTKTSVLINFFEPFTIDTTLYNENRIEVPLKMPLKAGIKYMIQVNLKHKLPWKCKIHDLKIMPNDLYQNILQFGSVITHFPIELDIDEKMSAYFTLVVTERVQSVQLYTLQIDYTVDNKQDFPDLLTSYSFSPVLSAVPKLVDVSFDFPSQTVQFMETPFSLVFKNLSDFPMDLYFSISESNDFFISGCKNVSLALLPDQEISYEFSFYALSHGSLSFPPIYLESRFERTVFWESKPSIFVSFSDNI